MAALNYGPRRGGFPSPKTIGTLACLTLVMMAGVSTVKSPYMTDKLLQITGLPDPVIHTSTTTTVTVHVGDTLWSIAQKWDKQDRPDAVVDEIERLSGLNDAAVYPGETLTVPVGRS